MTISDLPGWLPVGSWKPAIVSLRFDLPRELPADLPAQGLFRGLSL
jgi:hypothetical protein